MTAIFYFLSIILGFLGSLMLPTALIAISAGHSELAEEFLLTAGLTGFLSGGVFFALRGQEKELVNAQTYLLCILVWIGLPFVAAFPFVISGQLSGINALFESVSGLTTTGASVFRTLEGVPTPIIFWRSIIQWFGGFLTLLTFLLILAPNGVGGLPNRHIGMMERTFGEESGRTFYVARQVGGAYAILTLILAWLLILSGIPPFEAMCLAFSTLSTGGFMPIDGTLASYDNRWAEFLIAVGMVAGATSIFWHRMAVRGKLQMLSEHRESYYLFGLMAGLGLLYSIILFRLAGSSSVLPPLSALRQGFFTAVSLVSTSGFEIRHADVTVLPGLLVACLALIGATPFSTAGGLKLYRIGAMLMQAGREVGRLIYPLSIRGGKFGKTDYTIQLMKSIWASFLLSIVLVIVVAVVLSHDIGHFDGALFAAISAFSNIGPLYSAGWSATNAWPDYYQLSLISKYALIVTMICGRFEIIVLLGAININFWRR
jgi:trk system potassium uptake protein TrkH